VGERDRFLLRVGRQDQEAFHDRHRGADDRFLATFTVTPAVYTKRRRDFESRTPRKALGVVRPAISPEGKRVAFAALGDIYTMTIGGKPMNLTKDAAFDTDPAWSPDGMQLAYASDKGGTLMDLWVRDMETGKARQLTSIPTSALGPTWSPDGKRIAFLDVDGIWDAPRLRLWMSQTGTITKLHEPIFAPGNPTCRPTAGASRWRCSSRTRAFPRGDQPDPHLLVDERRGQSADEWFVR